MPLHSERPLPPPNITQNYTYIHTIPARDDTQLVSSDGSMTMMPADYTGVYT